MNEERISKADFARALGLSRARVTQLVHEGLPCEDGQIPADRAMSWYRSRIRCGMKLVTTHSRAESPVVARRVLDLLRAKAANVPSLVLALGGSAPAAIAAPDVFDALMFEALGFDFLVWVYGGDPPAIPAPDTRVLAMKAGLQYDPAWESEADSLLDRAQELLR